MPLVDASERDIIRTALDETIIVEAAAGTGKTTELVHRIVNVLAEERAQVDQIVAVTFTEKAAGELKLRLREGLEKARQDLSQQSPAHPHRAPSPGARIPDRRRNLEHALAHLEEAHVSTIHGFCADLLRERPVEARVDPHFEVLLDPDAQRLYAQAFELWLQQVLEDPPEGVRRSLRRASGSRIFDTDKASGAGPATRLRNAGWRLAEWRDFPAPWRRDPFDRGRDIDALLGRVGDFAVATRTCSTPTDGFYRSTWQARRLVDRVRTAETVRHRDYDGIEAGLVDLARDYKFRNPDRKGYGPNWQGAVSLPNVRTAHVEIVGRLQRFARSADADLAACLHTELVDTVKSYEALKARAGKLDFVDLLVRARDLLRDHDTVRADLQQRFTHLFVDEFQDTDPLQAEILLLLSSADPDVRDWRHVTPQPGKLFTVGDPKQSIYRFRRADVGVYVDVRAQLVERGARLVRLTTSFRASPSIQDLVNATFAPLMTGDREILQAEYVPLTPCREDPLNQPAAVVLSVPRPYGRNRKIALKAIERSLPDAVGAFVEWLIKESHWTVSEHDPNPELRTPNPEHRVPVAARHICLLFRRFEKFGADEVTRSYVEALEARGIPHLLVGGKTFHNREEVETMRAALAAIEWPDDELSVFAALRGSLFASSDEHLFEYRFRFGRLDPFRIPDELRAWAPSAQHLAPTQDVPARGPDVSHLLPIVQGLEMLRSLHRRRNYVPVTETIGRLLGGTRAHAGFVMRPSGEQALANVLQIAELARQYETGGGISFRGFVEQLKEEAESSQVAEAPILEAGSDGVRIMTVHKAKGLEFPVVILADITANLARRDASRYVDAERQLCALRIGGWSPADLLDHEPIEVARDEAEGVRVAYVAATRARDLLVVPAVGDGKLENRWISPLNEAIYPDRAHRRSPAPAPGCPEFGQDSVLDRPEEVERDVTPVAPGLYSFDAPVFLHAEAPGWHPGPRSANPDVVSRATNSPLAPSAQRLAPRYTLVWWDPSTLKLGAQVKFGLRQEELVGKDAPPEIVQADLQAYEAWKAKRDRAVEHGSSPSLVVQTATERAAALVRGEAGGTDEQSGSEHARGPRGTGPRGIDTVTLIELPCDVDRPSGPRYGTLVHAVLATVSLDADRGRVGEVAALQGRTLGATDTEVASAEAVVTAALRHPLMNRAREAAAKAVCRRETPVTFNEPGRALIEGVVDLAFQEGDTWTVVDFKTDRELLEEGLNVYRRQVKLYAEMVSQATGQPATAVLMKL